jgi:hypothetical protein
MNGWLLVHHGMNLLLQLRGRWSRQMRPIQNERSRTVVLQKNAREPSIVSLSRSFNPLLLQKAPRTEIDSAAEFKDLKIDRDAVL